MQENKRYTDGEEVANTATHVLGALLSAAGLADLCGISVSSRSFAASAVYMSSAVLMFAMSALYHLVRKPSVKQIFRKIDHSMIYVLIAGTYTPILMLTFSSVWGTVFLSLAWCIAAAGVIFSCITLKNRLLGTVIYLAGGWMALALLYHLWSRFPHAVVYWLIGGGIVYSLGCIFYMWRHVYSHALWHLFVIGGCCMHFMSIRLIVLSC